VRVARAARAAAAGVVAVPTASAIQARRWPKRSCRRPTTTSRTRRSPRSSSFDEIQPEVALASEVAGAGSAATTSSGARQRRPRRSAAAASAEVTAESLRSLQPAPVQSHDIGEEAVVPAAAERPRGRAATPPRAARRAEDRDPGRPQPRAGGDGRRVAASAAAAPAGAEPAAAAPRRPRPRRSPPRQKAAEEVLEQVETRGGE
jgi:hypothetical protein